MSVSSYPYRITILQSEKYELYGFELPNVSYLFILLQPFNSSLLIEYHFTKIVAVLTQLVEYKFRKSTEMQTMESKSVVECQNTQVTVSVGKRNSGH